MTVPSGNGQTRGPESAGEAGTPLPSRPDRARANNARNADFLGANPVKDQGGFGTEDMVHPCEYLGVENVRPSDAVAKPPVLASEGDGGEPFGGM